MHIDLRMVDVSDFVIAYCPTNIYSVGTPHEVVIARQQHKPVLMVCPQVDFRALHELRDHLAKQEDRKGQKLLEELTREVPIKPNLKGVPSLWYMPLLGGESFFDGFGFATFKRRFGWSPSPVDNREKASPPQRPLLPFLEKLDSKLPRKWDSRKGRLVRDDDWLLLDLDSDPVS